MAAPDNSLIKVVTYQKAELAYLQNYGCFVGKLSNTEFLNFQNRAAQLGSTVSFHKPFQFTVTNSLNAQMQPVIERVQTLTVDKEASISYAFTAEQQIFDVKAYMAGMGKDAVSRLAIKVEADIARNCLTHTYRFFGDGITPITSYNQLGTAVARYHNYGSPSVMTRGVLSDMVYPAVIATGANQFTPVRNDKIINSWEIGSFANCDWYRSNLLPVHNAGNVGKAQATLTVVTPHADADGSISSITFSGASASDPAAFKEFDKLYFLDGVANHEDIRYLQFNGDHVSENPVQVRVTAHAASDVSGNVRVFFYPPLQIMPVASQNLSHAIVPGLQAKALPSHRSGMIMGGKPLFLAMPALPSMSPYDTGNAHDPVTGVSMRHYSGAVFMQNLQGTVLDCIWGSTMADEYAMAIIIPL